MIVKLGCKFSNILQHQRKIYYKRCKIGTCFKTHCVRTQMIDLSQESYVFQWKMKIIYCEKWNLLYLCIVKRQKETIDNVVLKVKIKIDSGIIDSGKDS